MAVGVIIARLFFWPSPAFPTEQGWRHNPERAAWFKSLKRPSNGLSCCDVSDCRATEAEWRDGQWWAVVPRLRGPKWEPVPPRVVLPTKSIDERAYLCSEADVAAHETCSSYSGCQDVPEAVGRILCFVPPFQGS